MATMSLHLVLIPNPAFAVPTSAMYAAQRPAHQPTTVTRKITEQARRGGKARTIAGRI